MKERLKCYPVAVDLGMGWSIVGNALGYSQQDVKERTVRIVKTAINVEVETKAVSVGRPI